MMVERRLKKKRRWTAGWAWAPLLFVILGSLLVAQGPSSPELGGRVRGVVRDSSGVAIMGIPVRLLSEFSESELAVANSDEEGEFFFSQVSKGRYVVAVQEEGYEDFRTVIGQVQDQDSFVTIELKRVIPPLVELVEVYAAAPRTAATIGSFRGREVTLRAIETPGDVLRAVPGLVIAQHGGGGKADQYLLRGFDADHGSDFSLFLDGVPVNLVSHAHGHGYADLHFLIPETLASAELFKGPYSAEFGNLSTAGTTRLQLREEFDRSFVRYQGGRFDSRRFLVGLSPDVPWTKGFFALEGFSSDGPFLNPQGLRRLNLATRWAFPVGENQQLTFFATGYQGRWDSSGQIPLREVQAGRLDRFGQVDGSEGGRSSRYNLSVSHIASWGSQSLKSQFYWVGYDLDLYSNFTFALNDSVNGDGILQRDDRRLLGGHLQYSGVHGLFGGLGFLTLGLDYRQDDIDGGLWSQKERRVFSTRLDSDITERNLGLYLQEEISLGPYLKAVVGVRHDRFDFLVRDRTGQGPEGEESRSITLPKASLIATPLSDETFQIFLNYGRGFHSNDARSVVADPSGVALAGAHGFEVGVSRRMTDRLEVNFAYWLLDLEGELVWVGDEGTTELRGPSRRYGPELEVNWRISDFLWADFDISHSTGFFRDSGVRISRAPSLTYSGGLSFAHPSGLSGSLRIRGIGDFPLDDDGSFRGEGHTVADLIIRRRLSRRLDVVATVENLFDADVKEAQTFFESRLGTEAQGVGDNHFTPGNPISLRIGFQYNFDW